MTIVVNKLEKNLGKVTILIVYSLIVFFFLVNGEGLLTGWETNWTFNGIIYVIGVLLFLGAIDEFPEELKTSFTRNTLALCGSAVFTLLLLVIVRDFGLMFQNVNPMPYHLVPANMAFQLIVVASSEEIIFRGLIFGYLYDRFKLRSEKSYGWVIPYLGQAGIFALFHLAVYGVDLPTMALLFMMAIIFAYATERFGIGASIGAHWIWNCIAIGIFIF